MCISNVQSMFDAMQGEEKKIYFRFDGCKEEELRWVKLSMW